MLSLRPYDLEFVSTSVIELYYHIHVKYTVRNYTLLNFRVFEHEKMEWKLKNNDTKIIFFFISINLVYHLHNVVV